MKRYLLLGFTILLCSCTQPVLPVTKQENSSPVIPPLQITNKNMNRNVPIVPDGMPWSPAESVIGTFFALIDDGKLPDAVNMMDADDDTKQAWAVNFNTLGSIGMRSTEAVYKDEWTPSREIYKVTLEVSVKPVKSTYGWENGINIRWITLQKTGDVWMIHELANNP